MNNMEEKFYKYKDKEYKNIKKIMQGINDDPNNIFIQTGKSSDGSDKTVFLVNEENKQPKGQVICGDLKEIDLTNKIMLDLDEKLTSDCKTLEELETCKLLTKQGKDEFHAFNVRKKQLQ